MSTGSLKRLVKAARLFLAIASLLLLTVTVLQRDDRDGYQAAHLLFMPRKSWEMDQGRGMLHQEDYYTDLDLQSLASDAVDADQGDWPSKQGPALDRTVYSPAAGDNTIPLLYVSLTAGLVSNRIALVNEPSSGFTFWERDVPTPPPRG